MEDDFTSATDTTANALSLMQRIQHPEVTDEERQRLYAELNALLKQWWESLKTAFSQVAQQLVAAFKPFLDSFAQWADSLWQRAYPTPQRPPWKAHGYWKRKHREQKQARVALALRYRAKRSQAS